MDTMSRQHDHPETDGVNILRSLLLPFPAGNSKSYRNLQIVSNSFLTDNAAIHLLFDPLFHDMVHFTSGVSV